MTKKIEIRANTFGDMLPYYTESRSKPSEEDFIDENELIPKWIIKNICEYGSCVVSVTRWNNIKDTLKCKPLELYLAELAGVGSLSLTFLPANLDMRTKRPIDKDCYIVKVR